MRSIIAKIVSMISGGGTRSRTHSRSTGRGGLLSRLLSMFTGSRSGRRR